MALASKNKIKFIDGTLPLPAKTDTMYSTWDHCNTMVVSWIDKSLSSLIAQSVLWIDKAVDIWNDLKDRFSQGDVIHISELQKEIYAYK